MVCQVSCRDLIDSNQINRDFPFCELIFFYLELIEKFKLEIFSIEKMVSIILVLW